MGICAFRGYQKPMDALLRGELLDVRRRSGHLSATVYHGEYHAAPLPLPLPLLNMGPNAPASIIGFIAACWLRAACLRGSGPLWATHGSTDMFRSFIWLPFRSAMAFWASPAELISTMPIPVDQPSGLALFPPPLPHDLSMMIFVYATVPACEKWVLRSCHDPM